MAADSSVVVYTNREDKNFVTDIHGKSQSFICIGKHFTSTFSGSEETRVSTPFTAQSGKLPSEFAITRESSRNFYSL